MSKEIVEAVRGLAAEKNISSDKLMEALEDALLSAYKKTPGSAPYAKVEMDRDSGDFIVWELKIPPELEEQLLVEATEDAQPTVDPETGEMREAPEPEIDLEKLKAAPALNVLQGPELRTIFLGMDQKRDELLFSSVKGKNPFKDVRVRRAFYEAIDEETIKARVMRGAAAHVLQAIARARERGREAIDLAGNLLVGHDPLRHLWHFPVEHVHGPGDDAG